jgi:hypothetical protein
VRKPVGSHLFSHVLFSYRFLKILPTVLAKLGGVGWGRVGTQHPQFEVLNVYLYWLQCKQENQMYVVLIWSHIRKVVHQVFGMNF